ncbi:MAG: aldo/keto reductase [bacterium]|nr:aldo/keto reductase [bacterium]
MKYRKLGKTDIDVSVIALGCWPFAGGKVWGDQDDEVSVATVHAALDAGITFFDSAEGYGKGHSEAVLGRGLAGRRQDVVVATKVGGGHLGSDDVEKACDQSLQHLDMDYIDLYQIHWPNWNVPLEETMTVLERLKQKGKVRAIGVCNFAVQDLSDVLELGAIETDQLPYSLLWRAIEHEIQPLCEEQEVGIICYSPLSQGVLTGRYQNADEVPEGLARSRLYADTRPMAVHGEPGCEAEVFEAVDEVGKIAEEVGEPMATVALAWAMHRPAVTSLLVGARTPEEVGWNLPAVDLELSEDVIARLDAATDRVKAYVGTNPDMWQSESRMR